MGHFIISSDPGSGLFFVEIEVDNIPAVKHKREELRQRNPSPIRTLALVDTGASFCAATEKIIKGLQLPSKSDKVRKTMTAGREIETREYFGAIRLAGDPGIRADYATIQQFRFEGSPFDFIIGMSVLSRWDFAYTNVDQKLRIELPLTTKL